MGFINGFINTTVATQQNIDRQYRRKQMAHYIDTSEIWSDLWYAAKKGLTENQPPQTILKMDETTHEIPNPRKTDTSQSTNNPCNDSLRPICTAELK